MADLLWALAVPVLVCAVIFFLFRFFLGAAGGRSGGGGGGFGAIAVGWIVSAAIKITGAIVVALLNGLALPLLRALGRGTGAGWRAGVTSSAQRSTRTSARAASVPSPLSREFWWTTPTDRHFEQWERDHFTERKED